ncbi:hypothetical protein [Sulfobacillus harzensis]|uniref:Uncharacterized protein n=1 Tax=Sulfobacillus harzensis TaxID=2729629 RepID=A0A7Y0L7U2_9FIRM|nr:hypothetical protein [Sulfobacillus harzensis]NMP24908.1 hypothetical protein [Sulfobacillus harzensis]
MDFDFEYAWILSGQLTTTKAADLATLLARRFPVEPHDPERECHVTVKDSTIVIFLRYDAVIGDFLTDLLDAAPDAQGVLRLEWPYTELQEGLFPEDWRFDGAGQVAVHDYHLEPDVVARCTYTSSPG